MPNSGSELPISIEVEPPDGLAAVVRALKAEENGKQLRKDLAKNLKETLKEPQAKARSAIQSMPSTVRHAGPPLRPAIARRITPEVRLSGRSTGARLKARKIPNVRGFAQAPKYTNRKGWRRPVFGSGEFVNQIGKPNWFDDATRRNIQKYKAAAREALEDMAKRIASRGR